MQTRFSIMPVSHVLGDRGRPRRAFTHTYMPLILVLRVLWVSTAVGAYASYVSVLFAFRLRALCSVSFRRTLASLFGTGAPRFHVYVRRRGVVFCRSFQGRPAKNIAR